MTNHVPVCVADVKEIAKTIVQQPAWDYFRNGANEEQTLIDNCKAFQRYRLRPKVLVDVSNVDMSTTVLGSKIDFPICIAATAMNRMAHPLGEVAVAKAAASQNTGFMFSTWATSSVEEISTASPNSLKWLQLYIYKDRKVTKELVARAERCGYKGIFLTVDTPVIGLRYRDVRNNFSLPEHLKLGNFEGAASQVQGANNSGLAEYVTSLIDPSLQWSDVTWLKSITKLPIVLKGIVTGEMATLALNYEVDGILVSNHGARQLDGVPATIDALPEVVKAVRGQCEVYLDGGVRTGTDVLKALALGARAVFVGRPVIWGLAYKGKEGVSEVLNMMKKELQTSIQLMGCKSIFELQNERNLVVRESYYKSSL